MHPIVDQEGLVAVLDGAVDGPVGRTAQIDEIHPQPIALLEPEHDLDERLARLTGESQVVLGGEWSALHAGGGIEAPEGSDAAPEEAGSQREMIGDRAGDRQRRRRQIAVWTGIGMWIGMSRRTQRKQYRTEPPGTHVYMIPRLTAAAPQSPRNDAHQSAMVGDLSRRRETAL